MRPDAFHYFLFPHTILPERDFRHLSILIPRLSLLQALRAPVIPEWAREQFSSRAIFQDPEMAEQIELCLKGYQDFADLHGENSALVSMSQELVARDARESRFRIQGELKGKEALPSELTKGLLLEAAVFMEMARDLDERELELESGLARVEDLEKDFREILGVRNEEDLSDAIETITPPLVSDKASASFMLPRRIAFWLRLFSSRPPDGCPVLVTVSMDVIDELLDPIEAECNRTGTPLKIEQIALGSVPALDHLDQADFAALMRELRATNVLTGYWKSIEDLLREPRDVSIRQSFDTSLTTLRNCLEGFCKQASSSEQKFKNMTLICPAPGGLRDLWRCSDKIGYQALQEGFDVAGPPVVLLALS